MLGIYRAALILTNRIATSNQRPNVSQDQKSRTVAVHVIEFVTSLHRLNYPTYLKPHDAVRWTRWENTGKVGRSELAISFLANLFNASSRTVKKNVRKSVLHDEYDKHGVSEDRRDYLDNSRTLKPAMIYEKSWYLNLVDGHPDETTPHKVYFPA